MAKIFIENSATFSIDLNSKDIAGQTAFHFAIKSGHFNVAKVFLENSATVSIVLNAMDKSGKTALDWASTSSCKRTKKLMLNNANKLLANHRSNSNV